VAVGAAIVATYTYLPSQESRLRRVQCGLMLGPYGSCGVAAILLVGVTTVRPAALSELPRQRP